MAPESAAFVLPSVTLGLSTYMLGWPLGLSTYTPGRPHVAQCHVGVGAARTVLGPRRQVRPWVSMCACEAASEGAGAGALWNGLTNKGVHSATVLWVSSGFFLLVSDPLRAYFESACDKYTHIHTHVCHAPL